MIFSALLCALGIASGFMLLRRIPLFPPADPCTDADLSIIIPARNEEQNLPRLLRSISRSITLPTEIIVVDDHSTNATASIAWRLGARVIASHAKPAAWTGKSWACYQGAQSAAGQVLLFLDADTWFLDGGLDRMISCWLRERDPQLALSVLPHHEVEAPYEQLSLFFNILMAAGAGGFGVLASPRLFGQSLLISRSTYFRAGGHAAVPGVVLENLRWAGKLRASGARIVCLGGRGTLHMRMFPDGFQQMAQSWGKAFLQGATDSGALVLTVSTVWISALWSTTLLLILPRPEALPGMAIVYVLLCAQIWWLARRLGTYHPLTALLFPLPLTFYCLVFGRCAARAVLGRKAQWKGREV